MSTLDHNAKLLAASILAADYGCLGQEIERVAESGVKWIHIDVMDGDYVPPISFGAGVAALAKRHAPDCVCDVHLMVEKPERHLASFIDAGADFVSFHPETTRRAQYCVDEIHARGAKAGLALSPAVPLSAAEALLEQIDLLLIMTVEPGFGGQKMIGNMVAKVSQARRMIEESGSAAKIEVDGGVAFDTIEAVGDAGANVFVVGSCLFGSSDLHDTVTKLKAKLK